MSSWVGKSFNRRLVGLLKLNLLLENTTGLLIQMPISAQAYRIGGADKYPMVTRRKYSIGELEVPYIPGSSLKGRIRALVELALGKKLYTTDGKIWLHVRSLTSMTFNEFEEDVRNRDVVDELFGWAAANYKQILDEAEEPYKSNAQVVANQLFSNLAPTRFMVSDFFPTVKYVEAHSVKSIADFLEEKPENRIDRITSAADPREVVRVKPGVEFGGNITILFFDNDGEKAEEYLNTMMLGLKLLEETYLGSSGSRGYGRVRVIGESAIIYKINPPSRSSEVLTIVDEVQFESLDKLTGNKVRILEAIKKLYQPAV